MEKKPALDLIYALCQALLSERVSYCHWKSNAAIDRSATGDNDLDLLIDERDSQRFTEILRRLGFKEARVAPEQQVPGIQDYFGFDAESGKLVHVHAHYHLVLGDDMTKNYRLPIERPFLASASQGDLFRLPAPEFELVVLVIRMVLKHLTWDAILSRQGRLPKSARGELEYLRARVDCDRVRAIVQEHLADIGVELFERCVDALRPGCPVRTRVEVGRQLQLRLATRARRSLGLDIGLKLWRRGRRAASRRLLKRVSGRRPVSGGAVIALVGGDGAGKSTAVDDLYGWLSNDFDAIKVHMGKPDWSWTTVTLRGLMKLGTALGLFPFARAPIEYASDVPYPVFPGYAAVVREVCAARDRYRTYVKARRFAANGGLVICDRYPIPQIKLMDGPLAGLMTEAKPATPLDRLLVGVEQRYYQRIRPPKLLMVLRLDPEIAVQRKQIEDPVSVRARNQEIWQTAWPETSAHVIDACRSKEEVSAALRSLVWSVI